jgi:hypothetical protein
MRPYPLKGGISADIIRKYEDRNKKKNGNFKKNKKDEGKFRIKG